MTNLAWVRNSYQRPGDLRPNPYPLRAGRPFDWREVQIGRELSEIEVNQVNFIIKRRAMRYIAAGAEEWLYPERKIPTEHWRKLDDRYLLMPDPRAVIFSGEMIMSFKTGPPLRYDEYGRVPSDRSFVEKRVSDMEWRTHLRFQGEFARIFGPAPPRTVVPDGQDRSRGRRLRMSPIPPQP